MKIGILTFHCAINYGAVLQAYGLQETLKSMGHELSIIDYRPNYLLRPYRLFFPEAFKGHGLLVNIRFFIRELLAIPIRYKRRCAFNRFIERYLHLEHLDVQSEDNDFDCFVFGSDQIWNPQITGGDPIFFGDAPCFKGKKMLTYAASAGSVTSLKEIDIEQLKGRLSNLSALSVREKSLSDCLSEELQLENQLVVDPVLLAGKNIYKEIASNKKSKKPYLLFFSLSKNDEALHIARKKAVLKGLELVEMYSMVESIKDRKTLQCLTPNKFIGLFKDASYVVSTSFHGTVFSILFHKPFICIGHNFAKSRFHSLLNMVGLQNRLLDFSNQSELNFPEINWNTIDAILETKRKESMDFLKNALEK